LKDVYKCKINIPLVVQNILELAELLNKSAA